MATQLRALFTTAASQQASFSPVSCDRDAHQAWFGMSRARSWPQSSFGSLSKAWLLTQPQTRLAPGRMRSSSTSRSRSPAMTAA
eukprot:6196358-Pleurochrysis_carterae.AAC.1